MASYLQVENISKSYGDRTLFSNISFNINEGDKIALIAPNGTGKSSLLKILAGVESSDRGGEVKFMKDIRVAFLDQNTSFDPDRHIFDEVYSRMDSRSAAVGEYEQAVASGDRRRIDEATAAMEACDGWSLEHDIHQVLSSLHIDRLDRRMCELSGGEAKRVALACMILQHADFLILDEPTNHLDIPSREALERALLDFDGTIIAVSHDRYFIQKLATRIFDLSDHTFTDYRFGYEDFLAYKAKKAMPDGQSASNTVLEPVSAGKEQFLKNKADAAQKRKEERRRQKLTEDIAETEQAIAAIDEEMAGKAATDYKRLAELQAQKDTLEEKLLTLYEEEM